MSLHYLEKQNPEIVFFRVSGKLGIRQDHPHCWIEMKFCIVGVLQELVLRFEFHQNRLSSFGAMGAEICPFPLIWPLAYTKSLSHCKLRKY